MQTGTRDLFRVRKMLHGVVETALQLCKFTKNDYKTESHSYSQGILRHVNYTSIKQLKKPKDTSARTRGTDSTGWLSLGG